MYLTVTNNDTLNILAFNLLHREREIHQYQINIDNYQTILATTPEVTLTPALVEYSEVPPESLPAEFSLEEIKQLAAYQNRKRIAYLLRTESIEQDKAKNLFDALKAQIPADQLDALVADALVKVNAQTPSA